MKKHKYFIYSNDNEYLISHLSDKDENAVGINNINHLMIFLNDTMQDGEKIVLSTTEEANEMINEECWKKESCD